MEFFTFTFLELFGRMYIVKTYTDLSQALKEQDKVQVLDLSNQRLTEIPDELYQLTNLTRLYLAGNQVETIPPEIG